MQYLQAIILGLVQGITEFLPISSSGHLILFDKWLGASFASLAFDLSLHLGTLVAVVWFFRKDVVNLLSGLVRRNQYSGLAWIIGLATIPAVIAGVFLQDMAETIFRSQNLVAINLIVVAFVMLIADRVAKQSLSLDKLSTKKGVGIGIAQAVALIPGVSRSGITISAGLFAGMDYKSATRFSFLLSLPAIFGAAAKVLLSNGSLSHITSQPGLFLTGVVTSGISGYLAIRWLLAYLSKHGLAIFAYYRIALGVLVLVIGMTT